jgi:hypothetical protein
MSSTRLIRRFYVAATRQAVTSPTNNFKTKLALGAVAATAGGLYFLSTKPPVIQPDNAYIVSVGSLLDLNYKATIEAFMGHALTKGEVLTITPEIIQKVLTIDSYFKKGSITDKEFRALVCAALNIEASDAQFDFCWNAMLGDVSKLKQKIQAISQLHPNTLFISATNSIHAKKLGIDKPHFFLSYQNDCEDLACLQLALKKFNLNPATTTLVLRQDNQNVPPITDKNQALIQAVEEWMGANKIKSCKCTKQTDVFDAMKKCLPDYTDRRTAYTIQKH